MLKTSSKPDPCRLVFWLKQHARDSSAICRWLIVADLLIIIIIFDDQLLRSLDSLSPAVYVPLVISLSAPPNQILPSDNDPSHYLTFSAPLLHPSPNQVVDVVMS